MATATAHSCTLESGDHLSRAEFHRRYSRRPDIKKAELVEGVVYVAPPVRLTQHGAPHAAVVGLCGTYAAHHPGAVRVADSGTVILDSDNEVQPDVLLIKAGGTAKVDEDGYLQGPPELVVEIAASSASYDLHEKKTAYRRAGVREYVVWRVEDEAIDWFRLEDDAYVLVAPDEAGVIESVTFPGLRLGVAKLLSGDDAGALALIQ